MQQFKELQDPVEFAGLVAPLAWPWWKIIDPWQVDVLKRNDRFLMLNCSRQSGKSSILMLKALWHALTYERALILVIAEQRQSNENVRKARELTDAYAKYLKRKYKHKWTLSLISDNKTSFEFANGSRIIALPGTEKVRGYSAPDMIVVDEAAFLEDEVFVAFDPMLTVSKGQLILASTPNGTQGFFYREWHANPRYHKIRVPWQDCPRISEQDILQKREIYGEAYVRQEYGCEFLDDLSSLFTDASLVHSLDDTEDVFTEEFQNINKIINGEVQLI